LRNQVEGFAVKGEDSVDETSTAKRACAAKGPWGQWTGIARALILAGLLLVPSLAPGDEVRAPDTNVAVAEIHPAGSDDHAVANPDPWEKMNRGIFAFNEVADVYVLIPVARAWGFVTPQFFHTAIRNFNGLILMPTIFFNDVLQLKGKRAMEDVGRLLVNATVGLLGLIDVATPMGIPANDAGFGQTLGYWGAPPGPYLVLPLFGPSSIRGGIGRLGDGAGTFYFTWLPIWATFLVRGVDIISWRSDHIEEVELSRRESLDYYVFMRDAYMQLSQARVDAARGVVAAPPAQQDDLYFYDEEYEDDEGLDEESVESIAPSTPRSENTQEADSNGG
jgi:phospholipid-binding lipoprotein MlaA